MRSDVTVCWGWTRFIVHHVNVFGYNGFDRLDPSPSSNVCIVWQPSLFTPRGSWHWDSEKRIGDHHLHHHHISNHHKLAPLHQGHHHPTNLFPTIYCIEKSQFENPNFVWSLFPCQPPACSWWSATASMSLPVLPRPTSGFLVHHILQHDRFYCLF